jgi:uncharacterized membrane protein
MAAYAQPTSPQRSSHEPFRHWETGAAALTAAILFIPLPDLVTPGPGWLPAAVVAALLVPLLGMQEAMRRPGGWQPSPRVVRTLALVLLGLLALAEALVLALLLAQLPKVSEGKLLFRSAALIWAINLLVFALAYWELDGGGPAKRASGPYQAIDFLFPQLTNPRLAVGWMPEFLDYLFLAFNTGTAFSPTDTMVLSRPAKGLMMAQASISLLTIGLVVARGVNII